MSKIKKNHRTIYYIVLVLFIIIGCWYFIYKHDHQIKRQSNPKSSITKLPQPNTKASVKPKTPTSSNLTQGTSTPTNSTSVNTSRSKWVQSQSGLITLQQPIANSNLSNGFSLIGLASVNKVNYTLLDNSLGVISQGVIPVNNGSFSAIINFNNHSSSGRLDVYSTDPNGKEINEIQIPINFN